MSAPSGVLGDLRLRLNSSAALTILLLLHSAVT